MTTHKVWTRTIDKDARRHAKRASASACQVPTFLRETVALEILLVGPQNAQNVMPHSTFLEDSDIAQLPIHPPSLKKHTATCTYNLKPNT